MDTVRRRLEAGLASRSRTAAVPAVVAGLLAVADIVWAGVFLDGSSDGPAFVMALVLLVLIPALLASAGVVLAASRGRWRVVFIGAAAATGLAVAGLDGGVFVGDDPTDPVFIAWVADGTPIAALAAVVLTGVGAWDLLASLPAVPRASVALVAAVGAPAGLGLLLAGGAFVMVLLAIAAAVAVVVLRVVLGRGRERAPG